jgi:predicted GIY-YIG superfamily endonuclease
MGVRDLLFSALEMKGTYCVYVLASRSRSLYTGVTNDLQRRMVEHRQGLIPGFTARYRIFAWSISKSLATFAMQSRVRKKSRLGAAKRKSG